MTGPTSPVRAFGRVAAECALGGMFFGAMFGAAVGVGVSLMTGALLGTDGLGALAALMVITGAATFAFVGSIVGIVLGLGYGLAVGVGTGAVMAAATGSRRQRLPIGHLRLVAAIAAATSAIIATACFLLLNGGGRASLADELPLIVIVSVVFVLAPAAIAGGFAAWRSPGWTPAIEDVAAPQPR